MTIQSLDRDDRWARALAFAFAVCSFGYQLTLASAMSLHHGGQILWQCVTTGVFLCAAGLGAQRARRHFGGGGEWRQLVRVEAAAALLGGVSTALILLVYSVSRIERARGVLRLVEAAQGVLAQGAGPALPAVIPDGSSLPHAFFVVASQTIVAGVGFLSGYELPLLLARARQHSSGTILGFNYLGALLATLAYSFVLFPRLQLVQIAAALGLCNLLLCALVAVRLAGMAPRAVAIVTVAPIATLLIALEWGSGWLEQMQMRAMYYYQEGQVVAVESLGQAWERLRDAPPVERRRTPYQYIDLSRPKWLFAPRVLTMHINGDFQFNERMERYYHEGMVHVPIARLGSIPQRVLVLGAGDGLLVRELLRYGDRVAAITLVELDPAMVELARRHPEIAALNQHSLDDPKVRVVIDDALHYIRRTADVFDAIYVDFPYPYNYDLAKLFSVEIYGFARRLLAEQGFLVINGPLTAARHGRTLTATQRRLNSVLYSTLDAAGFGLVQGFTSLYESFLFATVRPRPLQAADANPGGLRFVALDADIFADLATQEFPHEVGASYVNSIFRPTFTDFGSRFH